MVPAAPRLGGQHPPSVHFPKERCRCQQHNLSAAASGVWISHSAVSAALHTSGGAGRGLAEDPGPGGGPETRGEHCRPCGTAVPCLDSGKGDGSNSQVCPEYLGGRAVL